MRIETLVGLVVITVIIFGIGAYALGQIEQTTTTNTLEYNVTHSGLLGIEKFSGLLPILVMISLLAIVIYIFATLSKLRGGF